MLNDLLRELDHCHEEAVRWVRLMETDWLAHGHASACVLAHSAAVALRGLADTAEALAEHCLGLATEACDDGDLEAAEIHWRASRLYQRQADHALSRYAELPRRDPDPRYVAELVARAQQRVAA